MDQKYFLMSETVESRMFKDGKPNPELFIEVSFCPLCQKDNLKILFRQWGLKYYKCKNCDFIFSNPRLNNKGAFIWYNSDLYNAAMKTEHYLARAANKYFSISLSDNLFDRITMMIEKQKFQKDIKVVDVGCGSGAIIHFLKEVQEMQNCVGFDLNLENIEFAKNVRNIVVNSKDIYDIVESDKFDLVISTENIEHISDPKKYVDQLIKLLKKNSYVLISTPHNDFTQVRLMGLMGDHFCAPNHQNYFNFKNLCELFTAKNFIVEDHWIDCSTKFNLFSWAKHFFVKQDQIFAMPPTKASIGWIDKNQSDISKSVILSEYTTDISNIPAVNGTRNLTKQIKKIIKNLLSVLIPLKFKTHQVVLFKYEG